LKELCTILNIIERMAHGVDATHLPGATLFYFTDNMVFFFVVQNGSSSNAELHKLICAIKPLKSSWVVALKWFICLEWP
jgi:hypothetical protein